MKHTEEAPRLRFIFEHFAKEHSLTRIQEELSRRGCTYRSGRPWGKGMLNHILRNPIYAGKIRFNGKIYPGQHEALVSEAMLHKTQTAKRDGSHGPSKQPRFFILKGLLKCADCGSAMTPHYSQKRNRDGSVHRVPYYRCTKTIHFNSRACRLKHLNADKIEKKVVTDLYALTENVDFVQMSVEEVNRQNRAKVGPQQQELDTLTKRLTGLDKEIERFMQAFGKGSMPLELLEKEVLKRQTDQKHLRAQCEDLQQQINDQAASAYDAEAILRGLRQFRTLFDSMPPPEQVNVMQDIVKDVVASSPEKIALNVFERPCFNHGSQNQAKWLHG